MSNYKATITARGEGLQKLQAGGFLSQAFQKSAGVTVTQDVERWKADNEAGYIDRDVAKIQGSRDTFNALAKKGALPEAVSEALDTAGAQLTALTDARRWWNKLVESIAYSVTVGVHPLMETEAAVKGYPETTVSVARYNI